MNGAIICDYPNENLNVWNGQIIEYDREEIQCDIDNIILKGCFLKNTEYICGIIVYSGKNTKIMKNAKNVKSKSSKMMHVMKNFYIVYLFLKYLFAFYLDIPA